MTEIATAKTVKRELTYVQKMILFFFIYAFIGWCLETIYCIYELGAFHKRGFLLGPICPIYGFGAVILITCLQNFKNDKFKLFIVSAVVFTIFEYLASFGIEAIFAKTFWDYSTEFLNLNGRVTLMFSVIWGLFGIIFMTYFHPTLERFANLIIDKLPTLVPSTIINILCGLYAVDTIVSFIRYLIF